MDLPQLLGWTATFLFSIMIIPQMIRTVKSKDTRGVSLLMFIIFLIANIIALSYALLINQFPLIIKYILALITTIIYLILYGIYYRRKKKSIGEKSRKSKGTVLWFTGLSGSGKTTIAENLKKHLEQQGKKVEVLDGDIVRNTLHKNLGFTPDDIHENNRLLALLATEKAESVDYVLLPIISPFQEDREKARTLIGKNFVEIFIDASLQECIKRDVKGHYKKALSGEIKNFIGIATENPYQQPSNPEIAIETSKMSIEESVQKITGFINQREEKQAQ